MINLHEAFSLFSKECKSLEHAYDGLQKEFEKLETRSILPHIDEGVIFISNNSICTLCNQAASKILGVSSDNILGKKFESIFEENFFGFSLQQGSYPKKSHVILQNDKEIDVSLTRVPEKGYILVLHDVTLLNHLKKAALQNDKLRELGEMAAFLAHEIRNPLSIIFGFVSLLKLDLKETQLEMVEAISTASQSINRLISSILDYSRPLNLSLKKWDLLDIFNDILPHFNCKLEAEKIPYFVLCDRELIKCTLINIIKNGVEASNAEVVIRLLKKETSLCIEIEDCGPGIKESDLSKIFTPFFTTKKGGTGLGLSESYKIIKAHGGDLFVSSTSQKTRFTLELPCL